MRLERLDHCNVCDGKDLLVLDAGRNIVQCRSCGYIFDNPRPSAEEIFSFYSRSGKYDSWLQELEPRERLWKKRLRKLLPFSKRGSLLDVGAGIGQFLALARASYSSVDGTEVSASAVQIARERYGLEIFHGTVEEFLRSGRTFDNVTLFHVLEHVHDPRKLLLACHSLLSPGGIIAVAVPNEVSSLRVVIHRVLRKLGLRNDQRGNVGLPLVRLDGSMNEIHLSHFTPRVLERLMTSCGFEPMRRDLDACLIATGFRKIREDAYYSFCRAILLAFRVNLYDAMLLIARKRP